MSLQSYHLVWLQAHPEHSAEWLKAKLREGFHVHHIDFDHSNDAPGNLVLVLGTDHLANLHGWKLQPRKVRPERVADPATPAAAPAPPRRAPGRAFSRPPTFKRDPAAFIDWQESMGFSNNDAARALYVSANTIADFRRRGATARHMVGMWAIVAGIRPDTPWQECQRIGVINKALTEIEELKAIPGL